ncbi:MAG: hypothetical protein ABWY45_00915 [Mycobacterium sp.]
MRAVISNAGCGLPAAALVNPAVANWVRVHGITVTAHDDDELDLLQFTGIRPVQIVYCCGPAAAPLAPIGRAATLGVSRFIVTTSQQIARVADGARTTRYLYLDEHAPLVLGDRRLRIIGLHGDVDDAGGAVEWASVVERLLCRSVVLKTCGSPITRITLSGGSTDIWLRSQTDRLASIVSAVDVALRTGCERRQLMRPAVSLSPLTAAGSLVPADPAPGRRKHPRGWTRFHAGVA